MVPSGRSRRSIVGPIGGVVVKTVSRVSVARWVMMSCTLAVLMMNVAIVDVWCARITATII